MKELILKTYEDLQDLIDRLRLVQFAVAECSGERMEPTQEDFRAIADAAAGAVATAEDIRILVAEIIAADQSVKIRTNVHSTLD